jgi:hypothetical protein
VNRRAAGSLGAEIAVEAIRQPVMRAVVEQRHRRQLSARLDCFGVLVNGRLIQLCARLCAAVNPDF